jgi:hypothetical protein
VAQGLRSRKQGDLRHQAGKTFWTLYAKSLSRSAGLGDGLRRYCSLSLKQKRASGLAEFPLEPQHIPILAELPPHLRVPPQLLKPELPMQRIRSIVRLRNARNQPMDVLARKLSEQRLVKPRSKTAPDRSCGPTIGRNRRRDKFSGPSGLLVRKPAKYQHECRGLVG